MNLNGLSNSGIQLQECTEEPKEVTEFLLETWQNLPESIKSDECFKVYQNEVQNRENAFNDDDDDEPSNKYLTYLKTFLLITTWLFIAILLLIVPEKSLTRNLLSVPPHETLTLTLTSNGTIKHAIRISFEGHFTNERTCYLNESNCLTICLNTTQSFDCMTLPSSNTIQKRHLYFRVKGDETFDEITLSLRHNIDRSIALILTIDFDVYNPIWGILLATFVLVFLYGLIIWEVVHRTFAALFSSAFALAALAFIEDRPTMNEVIRWIDVETIMLLFSMMILVSILTETGIFNYMAVFVYKVTKGKVWALIHSLCILTTIISAFLDNVTTTLLIAPVTITLCEVMNLNPVPVLMAIVIHANIGGTATPVGDPPNVIITSNPHVSSAGVSFVAFAVHMGLGVIFCVLATTAYLRVMYRDLMKLKIVGNYEFCNAEVEKEFIEWETALEKLTDCRELMPLRQKMEKKIKNLKEELSNGDHNDTYENKLKMMEKMYPIKDKVLLFQVGGVLAFVISLFLIESVPELQRISLSWCALLGVFLLLIIAKKDDMDKILSKVEWPTLLFFAAMFIIMEIVDRLGLIHLIGEVTKDLILSVPQSFQLSLAIVIILWISGIVSAFVDSIPVTTMMVKVVVSIAENKDLGLPLQPLIWALAFGPCLGGNGTLVGASANVICAGVAQQRGYKISFIEFLKLGFPVMTVTLFVTTIYLLLAHSIFEWQ